MPCLGYAAPLQASELAAGDRAELTYGVEEEAALDACPGAFCHYAAAVEGSSYFNRRLYIASFA